MKAIILTAGKSTRTEPLTLTRPKPLLKIANKTILNHILDNLHGIVDEVILVIGYKKEMIVEKFGDNYKKIKLTYVEQSQQLGTGHAVMQCKNLVDNKFIVMSGDDLISSKDIKNCVKANFSILVNKVEDYKNFGICEVKDNKLVKIHEKPDEQLSSLANTGFYVVNKDVFVDVKKSKRDEIEFTDMVNEFCKKKDMKVIEVKDYWLPIGYPWDLIKANNFLLKDIKKEIKGEVEKNVTIKGSIQVGEGTKILSGTYIEGNVIIGNNCKIGPNCYLRGNTSIGNNCHIGQAVEIKNTIIMDGSKVPHLSYIGDSVIGFNSNLGAGTITANLRHDNANVKSIIKNELISTGRRKFGTIIGDDVHTGINTMIYPGRKIWPGLSTKPGEIVNKDITE